MDPDHGPDTLPLQDEAAPWAATQMDDVFDSAVRVVLSWRDVEAAVQQGAVVPAQAHALWGGWAALGSEQRVTAPEHPPEAKSIAAAAAVPAMAVTPQGSSLGVLLGLALAAALVGGVLSYALFGR